MRRKPGVEMEIWSTDGIMWRSLAPYRAAAALALNDLEPVRDHGPLDAKAMPLVVVLKNEERLIGSFLAHYRALGVTRFMIVDNGSCDATLEILRRQDDVDLWRTDASFKAANQGCLWRDGLLFARARDRWALSVDADEFLVFAGMERPGALRRLTSRLEKLGDTRLLAPMLDVYSDRPIADVEIDPHIHPLETLNWFDGDPEIFEIRKTGIWIGGGPRRRLFFAGEAHQRPGLSKFPLVRYDSETAFVGIHHPSPYDRNAVRIFGRLMHIKLHAGLVERAREAIDSGEYWQESAEYRRYAEILAQTPGLTAHGQNSLRYQGPASLVEAGLMENPASVWRFAPRRIAERAFARRALPKSAPPKSAPHDSHGDPAAPRSAGRSGSAASDSGIAELTTGTGFLDRLTARLEPGSRRRRRHGLLAAFRLRDRTSKSAGEAGGAADGESDAEIAQALQAEEQERLRAPGALSRKLAKIDAAHAFRRLYVMGCGRSGTWLLTAAMSTFDDVEILPREAEIEDFGSMQTNRSALVLKRSHQSYQRIHEIPDSIEIVYAIRHPFDVLTSLNPNYPQSAYHISPDRWLGEMLALQYLVDTGRKNTLLVRYEDLVAQPQQTQARIAAALALKPRCSMDEIERSFAAPEEAVRAMHGQRPIDTRSMNRFRHDPAKIDYLKQIRPRLGRLLSWVAETYDYDIGL